MTNKSFGIQNLPERDLGPRGRLNEKINLALIIGNLNKTKMKLALCVNSCSWPKSFPSMIVTSYSMLQCLSDINSNNGNSDPRRV